MVKIKFSMSLTTKISKGNCMNFTDVKKDKENDQAEYKKNIDEKRSIPDVVILQPPDEEFISPVDIRDYK